MEPGDTLAERHMLIRAGQFGGVRKERGQAHGCHPWAAWWRHQEARGQEASRERRRSRVTHDVSSEIWGPLGRQGMLGAINAGSSGSSRTASR